MLNSHIKDGRKTEQLFSAQNNQNLVIGRHRGKIVDPSLEQLIVEAVVFDVVGSQEIKSALSSRVNPTEKDSDIQTLTLGQVSPKYSQKHSDGKRAGPKPIVHPVYLTNKSQIPHILRRQSMIPQKEATLEQAKQILNFQVNKLKAQTEFFKKMFSHLQKTAENYQLIPMLLALSLNDMVFVKYELEEQDFMKNVNDTVIMQNLEIMNIFKEMELAIIKLMQELGIITQEAGNMMQAQSLGPNNPYTTNLPGMQPGTNPLELLQLQQLQQFEQMQRAAQQAQQKK